MAATSAAGLKAFGTPFLSGNKGTKNLLASSIAGTKTGAVAYPRGLVVVAQKKSWLPGVRTGGNLVDPEWLDGS